MLEKVIEAGAEIKTTVPIEETVDFVLALLEKDIRNLSGKFIHVRDDINNLTKEQINENFWKLRRIE